MPRGLEGKRVLVTRPLGQAQKMLRALARFGAEAILFPTISIESVGGRERDRALDMVRGLGRGEYVGVLVTSANAAKELQSLLTDAVVSLEGLDLFAIGDATAEAIESFGSSPMVADESVAEGMAARVREHYGTSLRGRRLLFPRARAGRDHLVESLGSLGAQVDLLVVYDTVPLVDGPPVPSEPPPDWITFMSPSAVQGLVARGPVPEKSRIACVGRTTAEEARTHGLEVAAIPTETSAVGLVAAMAAARASSP